MRLHHSSLHYSHLSPSEFHLLLRVTVCLLTTLASRIGSFQIVSDLALQNLLLEFDSEAQLVRWLPARCE